VHPKSSFLHGERWGAFDYQSGLHEYYECRQLYDLHHGARLDLRRLRVEVTCPRMYTHVVPPHADMQRLYRIDYNTDNSEHSPKLALYDVGTEVLWGCICSCVIISCSKALYCCKCPLNSLQKVSYEPAFAPRNFSEKQEM
jgi:hypothetical protein